MTASTWAALAGEHQPRDVQAAAQFVVGQGLLEGQEDETALRLAVHGGGQARRARLELLAGVGLEAGAALHQQPEGARRDDAVMDSIGACKIVRAWGRRLDGFDDNRSGRAAPCPRFHFWKFSMEYRKLGTSTPCPRVPGNDDLVSRTPRRTATLSWICPRAWVPISSTWPR